MLNNNLQIIGCKTLDKTVMGLSIGFTVDKARSDLLSKQNERDIYLLWQTFMKTHYPKIVPHLIDENIISIDEYIATNVIKKWAAVEIVNQYVYRSEELNILTIKGEYYGFIHTGSAVQFNQSFSAALNYLEHHDITIDKYRPRLEIMHRNYLPENILAEEEFWIPIQLARS